jgi:hypothetical protein
MWLLAAAISPGDLGFPDWAYAIDPINAVVAVDFGDVGAPVRVLASGHDFYASPRLSPDGKPIGCRSARHHHVASAARPFARPSNYNGISIMYVFEFYSDRRANELGAFQPS